LDVASARLILLPGLGADHRLFGPLRGTFPRLEVPAYPPPERGESLARFAERLAERLDPRPPFHLGGSSMGGMIALEMARRLRPEALFLIGSCRDGRAIAAGRSVIGRVLPRLPTFLYRLGRIAAPRMVGQWGRMSPGHRRLFLRMLADCSPGFLKWGMTAILSWPGPPAGAGPRCPVHHIHGGADPLLPPRFVKPDEIIEGAGHLIALTRPGRVARFIRERISGCG
jgi:pimeloyl-ACP methyl ester carboxylesterase